MKKSILYLLLPLFSLSLTSCSKGFEMINEGEHGNTYSGGSTTNPSTREELDEFLKGANSKLNSDEYKSYSSKGVNVYLEQEEKDTKNITTKTTSTSLVKNNKSLTTEIYEKENKTKKNVIYSDASSSEKIRVSFDSYLGEDLKRYVSEETKVNGNYSHLKTYYQTSSWSYLDYMKYLLSNFDSLYNYACIFNDNLTEALQSISVFKGEAYVKQDGKNITYKYFNFDLQHEKLILRGEIFYTGDYDIKKLNLKNIDKEEGTSSKAYMSLLPYDKDIKPLSEKDRETIDPKDIEKLIH